MRYNAIIMTRLFHPCPELRLRNRTFVWGSRTYVMGILNLTPDSFSGDGLGGSETGRRMLCVCAGAADAGRSRPTCWMWR